jgi:hypothetical protein
MWKILRLCRRVLLMHAMVHDQRETPALHFSAVIGIYADGL